jgi:hypothetical protein
MKKTFQLTHPKIKVARLFGKGLWGVPEIPQYNGVDVQSGYRHRRFVSGLYNF